MQLACHIRHIQQLERLTEAHDHLMTFYPAYEPKAAPQGGIAEFGSCTRIYVGDEFCAARMPSLPALKRFAESAASLGVAISLLTPVMTDADISRLIPLFAYLNTCGPAVEIVFNDWGVMTLLRSNYPALKLSAGRALNKGFKDPRLKPAEQGQGLPNDLLDWSSFDGLWIQDHLMALGIDRCEHDLLPYQTKDTLNKNGFKTAIYFPFGYITSGRICWMASFDQPAAQQFIPPARCARPCNRLTLELKNGKFGFRILQSGNTIFYLYPRQRLEHLLQIAGSKGARMIYQGFGLDPS